MSEQYKDNCAKYDRPCREIVTKEVLYERLNNDIRETEIRLIREEVRLQALRETKRNLDEYFEDLEIAREQKASHIAQIINSKVIQ